MEDTLLLGVSLVKAICEGTRAICFKIEDAHIHHSGISPLRINPRNSGTIAQGVVHKNVH